MKNAMKTLEDIFDEIYSIKIVTNGTPSGNIILDDQDRPIPYIIKFGVTMLPREAFAYAELEIEVKSGLTKKEYMKLSDDIKEGTEKYNLPKPVNGLPITIGPIPKKNIQINYKHVRREYK